LLCQFFDCVRRRFGEWEDAMPQYSAPGVYVEESGHTRKIAAVTTGTAAFLGLAARGPLQPQLVTSFVEYRRWFGRDAGRLAPLPYCVRGFFENGGRRLFVARIVAATATTASARIGRHFTLKALGPGSGGRRIYTCIENCTRRTAEDQHEAFRLRVAYYDSEPDGNPRLWFNGAAAPRPDDVEEFDHLLIDSESPAHWERQLEASTLVRLVRDESAPADAMPEPGFRRLDQGGVDGADVPATEDFVGQPTQNRVEPQGLAAWSSAIDSEVSIVYAPGVPPEVARSLVAHCESVRHCFAIIDGPADLRTCSVARDGLGDSSRAALYVPWILVKDFAGRSTALSLPPGGHVAGVYARSDRERGVHRAPADEPLAGVVGIAATVSNRDQEALNPLAVNVIREFAGRGLRIWGARTLSSDPEFRYVNVSRLLIFLEHSIDRGIKWVLFEPNGERLWAQLADAIRDFLTLIWHDGALQGQRQEQAFFVRCDRTTMTQEDIDQGRIVCEIGVAVVKPAEFVIFSVTKRTGSWRDPDD
jgi:phage tail sheath protein FI